MNNRAINEKEKPLALIYPEYCHELSPTIKKWCPVSAEDLCALEWRGVYSNGRRLYHFGNHPVKWVRLTGVVVAVDEARERRVWTLDDSSGVCVECTAPMPTPDPPNGTLVVTKPAPTKPKAQLHSTSTTKPGPSVTNPNIPWDEVDVGTVIKVKGGISNFWDQKRVEVIKIEVLKSTDQEVRCWDEVVKFRREVLDCPWVVTPEMEERCRRRVGRVRKDRKMGGGEKSLREQVGKRQVEDKRNNTSWESEGVKRDRYGQEWRDSRRTGEEQKRRAHDTKPHRKRWENCREDFKENRY
ncbi:hypothetical protein BGZ60DRAFT_528436 [Tricladium varicosporioides]|nr:hypothetical protein BGZ60DRAFT_528436 [Hymenoscyphus varicosporioides]